MNTNQTQTFEFLKNKATTTHVVNDTSFICVFDNTKIIEFDFYDENEICLTFDEIDQDCESQTTYDLSEINDDKIDHVLSFVDPDNSRLEFCLNQQHATLLKSLVVRA